MPQVVSFQAHNGVLENQYPSIFVFAQFGRNFKRNFCQTDRAQKNDRRHLIPSTCESDVDGVSVDGFAGTTNSIFSG